MDPELVERVSKAIKDASEAHAPWMYEEIAKAAIEAVKAYQVGVMREAMLTLGARALTHPE